MTRGQLQFGGNTVNVWLEIEDGEIRASSVRPKESIRFQDFAGKYESEILPQLKPASQLSIKSNIRILNETFGKMRLADIGTEDLQRFAGSHPYSPVTVKNRLATMRMIWTKARAWKYVKENPFEFLSMPRQPLSDARRLSVDDMRAFVRKADEPFKTMLMILTETGIRGGELAGLYRGDIAGGAINIVRSAFRKQIQTPKTGNAIRSIAISGRLADILCNKTPQIRGFGANLLFEMPDGRPWDNGEIVRRLKPVLGPGVGLHAFRHANASLMASLGVPEHIRRERLGHSSGNITARYTHSNPSDHRRWAEAIGQAVCTENVQRAYAGGD